MTLDRVDLPDPLKQFQGLIQPTLLQLLLPKAVRAELPKRTLEDEAAITQWLADAETELREKLKEGPVIV